MAIASTPRRSSSKDDFDPESLINWELCLEKELETPPAEEEPPEYALSHIIPFFLRDLHKRAPQDRRRSVRTAVHRGSVDRMGHHLDAGRPRRGVLYGCRASPV